VSQPVACPAGRGLGEVRRYWPRPRSKSDLAEAETSGPLSLVVRYPEEQWRERVQFREQRPLAGQLAQNPCRVFSESLHSKGTVLLTCEADDTLIVINVLGGQSCQVALRRPDVPGEFEECFPLQILLPSQQGLMFFPSDAALLPVVQRRPLMLRQHRPRKPSHGEREAVQPPQAVIGRHCTCL